MASSSNSEASPGAGVHSSLVFWLILLLVTVAEGAFGYQQTRQPEATREAVGAAEQLAAPAPAADEEADPWGDVELDTAEEAAEPDPWADVELDEAEPAAATEEAPAGEQVAPDRDAGGGILGTIGFLASRSTAYLAIAAALLLAGLLWRPRRGKWIAGLLAVLPAAATVGGMAAGTGRVDDAHVIVAILVLLVGLLAYYAGAAVGALAKR